MRNDGETRPAQSMDFGKRTCTPIAKDVFFFATGMHFLQHLIVTRYVSLEGAGLVAVICIKVRFFVLTVARQFSRQILQTT